jgi:hypothetical protein
MTEPTGLTIAGILSVMLSWNDDQCDGYDDSSGESKEDDSARRISPRVAGQHLRRRP